MYSCVQGPCATNSCIAFMSLVSEAHFQDIYITINKWPIQDYPWGGHQLSHCVQTYFLTRKLHGHLNILTPRGRASLVPPWVCHSSLFNWQQYHCSRYENNAQHVDRYLQIVKCARFKISAILISIAKNSILDPLILYVSFKSPKS